MRTRLELLKATPLKTTAVIQKREDSWTGPEVGIARWGYWMDSRVSGCFSFLDFLIVPSLNN